LLKEILPGIKTIISDKISQIPDDQGFDFSYFSVIDQRNLEYIFKNGSDYKGFNLNDAKEFRKTMIFLTSAKTKKEVLMLTHLYCVTHLSYEFNSGFNELNLMLTKTSFNSVRQKKIYCSSSAFFYYSILKSVGAEPVLYTIILPRDTYGHMFGFVKFQDRCYFFDNDGFRGGNDFLDILNVYINAKDKKEIKISRYDPEPVLYGITSKKKNKPVPFRRAVEIAP